MKKPLLKIALLFAAILIVFILIFSDSIFQEGNPINVIKGIIEMQNKDVEVAQTSHNPVKYIIKNDLKYVEITEDIVLKIPKDYEPDEAIKNGDVVNVHGEITNLGRLENFIDNTKNGKADIIRITSYTIEGDPIIQILIYDGKEIEYITDTTRDFYGAQEITRVECTEIDSYKKTLEHEDGSKETLIIYRLLGCEVKPEERSILVIPEQN